MKKLSFIFFLTFSTVTAIFVDSEASQPTLPSLNPSVDYDASAKKTIPTGLPVLAEPELKVLSENEKQVIGEVVDSVFEEKDKFEKSAGNKSVNPEVKNKEESISISPEKEIIPELERSGSEVTVPEVTERSILDSKKEIAEKVKGDNPGKSIESAQDIAESQEPNAKNVDEDAESFKVFDATEIIDLDPEENNNSKVYPVVRHYEKPINWNSTAKYRGDSESISFTSKGKVQKSLITLNSNDFSKNYDSPAIYNSESLYDSLDRVRNLPDKKLAKKTAKKPVVIERGVFNDPFYEEVEIIESTFGNDSNSNSEVDLESYNISSIEKPLDIESVKPKLVKKTKKKNKKFHFREKDLLVEVKPAKKTANNKNYKLAHEAIELGQYESAIAYYRNLLQTNPRNKKILFGLATAYHKANQYDEAKKAYLSAIKVDKNYWQAINNYIILVAEESPENAEENLLDLWYKNPNLASIPAQIANLSFKNGNYEKAAKFYGKAISLDKNNYNYFYNLAIIYEKMGDRASAARIYKRIIESSPDSDLPESKAKLQKRFYQLLSKR